MQSLVARSLRRVEAFSPGGIYIGEEPAIEVQNMRLAACVAKIAIGLRWLHRVEPFPQDHGVFVWLNVPDERLDAPLQQRVLKQPVIDYGDGTFTYGYIPSDANVDYDSAIMSFYRGYYAIAAITAGEVILRSAAA